MNVQLILASQSPRRAELLRQMGLSFGVEPVDLDESLLPDESPEAYVQRLAQRKAEAVSCRFPTSGVIGADTTVVADGMILAKPVDEADFRQMLRRLSGTTHQVLTAVALKTPQRLTQALSVSRVTFTALSEAEITAYWRSGEPADKAGGYAIQGLAAIWIERLEGSYSGVMGLPLFETAQLLRQQGYRLGVGVDE